MPLISVIMPVYNAREDELRTAIESILKQTFADFEFIIINDASTNNTEEVIFSYNDERIKYFKNEQNLKLIATLNKGLEIAKGKYIARLDSDDYSSLDRFEKQVKFLKENPNIGLVGSFYNIDGRDIQTPFQPQDVKVYMRYLRGCISHSSVMFRKSILDEHNLKYDKNCLHAEDHKLWSDMSRFCDIAVYPEVLTYLRTHEDGLSMQNLSWQNKMVNLILLDNIIKDFAANKKYMYSILVKYLNDTPLTDSEFEGMKMFLNQVIEYLYDKVSYPHNQFVERFILSMLKSFTRENKE